MTSYSNLPRPEPSAGLWTYERELAARLLFDVRCADNYARFKVAALHGWKAEVDYLPVKLDIENVSRCNFACTMCTVSTWPKGKRADDMTLDAFKKLIDEQYGLVEIKLNGLGEPLMQGDDFFEMIRYARARRIWVRVTTNASLLHLRDNISKLVGSGVNEIDISVDGVDAKTFEGIRVQSDFSRVAANCAALNAYCDAVGVVRTKMWTLVQKANCHRLGDHVRFAAAHGFRHMVFSMQLHGWGSDALAKRNHGEMVELDQEFLNELMAIGEKYGVRVAFWDVSEKFDREHLCPWPFSRAVVTSDSRTVPCCMIGDPSAFELGVGKPFAKAWTGEEYRAFRQAHLDGAVPKICEGCYR